MNKDTFIKTFKILADESGVSFNSIAKLAGVGNKTITKWYNGKSTPINTVRDIVINELQNRAVKRKEKQEFEEKLFNSLKDNLRIEIVEDNSDYYKSTPDYTIVLKFKDKVISEDSLDLRISI